MDISNFSVITDQLIYEVEKIIVGKTEQIRMLIMAVLSEGHILLEDIPGVGKTTLVKTLSYVLGCDFKRIQFTPDLLPSDIVGVTTYNQKLGDFQFIPGPVMTHILLADEINRATPRTQSALLEAMEERQITVDGKTYPLDLPFIVMATQNPIESEGTFPLPAAQIDRFMIKLSLGYPTLEEESQMLAKLGDEMPFSSVKSILSPQKIIEIQNEIRKVYVSDAVMKYITTFVQATRCHPLIKLGASPRASKVLYKGGKVWAAMHNREFVTPDDIQKLAVYVLSHRLILTNEARLTKKRSEDIINEIILTIPAPPDREGILIEN